MAIPHPEPTPLEIAVRLESLRARLEAARADDEHHPRTERSTVRDADETATETLARLRALEARLRTMGGSVP